MGRMGAEDPSSGLRSAPPLAMAVVDSAEAGIRSAALGATVIQLRAPRLTARELEKEATRLRSESPVPVIVSGRCDVALAADLAGVNLPESDLPAADARKLLGGRWVSRSVHSLDAALASTGADYVIFGPVWETATHPGARPFGLDQLRLVARESTIPVIAIGGVTRERVPELAEICAGYAAISLFK